jgi:8-oxo-dGTP diphosphatase
LIKKKFATMIVLNQDQNEVLLILREDFRIWGLPGGTIESGETPEAAAIRETSEETGFDTEIVRYCGAHIRPRMKDVRYVFQGRITGGEALENGPETIAVRWFKVSELPKKTTPFLKEIVQDALTESPQPYEKIQHVPIWLVVTLRLMIWLRDLRNRWIGKA